ncbi:MAG: ATPase [Bacteroidaceae bacterium]|nr:ATPase [Bacteroidaceae bacterium]
MRLIADSGSTKTAWHIAGAYFETQGINPFHQQEDVIRRILHDELLPQLPAEAVVTEVSFYGAGCTPQMSPRLVDALHAVLDGPTCVEVGSDMLGAARALCQRNEGIACILGTGANSCLYDGTDIVANVSPLGYILGDEGSAAYIGKRLVGDVLKQQMPPQVCQLFYDETHHTAASIVENVYRRPLANRFLGELSRFCSRHRDLPAIHQLLVDSFSQFFVRNVANYQRPDLEVNFIGSIAHYYSDELHEAAAQLGFKVGTTARTPMQGLIHYHGE